MGERAERGVRTGFVSVSTLLQYAGMDRTFSFLHALRGRIAAADYLGVATLDPTIHEQKRVNAIRSLYDGAIEVRESDDGRRQVRAVGLPGATREWTDW